MLEEVPPERVAGAGERLVAGRDPRASLDQVVAAVERRHGEVVVERMDLEPLERHDRRPGPLPDIADDVAELALGEGIDGAARREMLEIEIARGPFPRRMIPRHAVAECLPVGLGREENVFACLPCQPAAIGLGLEAVHLDRPVERQRPLVEQVSLPVAVAAAEPEFRVPGFGVVEPAAALLRPQRFVAVAARRYELQKISVGDQPLPRTKRRQDHFVASVFVVPAVGRVVATLAELHGLAGDRQPLVRRRNAGRPARAPESPLLRREFVVVAEFVERHLPHDHARCLEMDPLVLDAHENDPCGRVGADRQFERHRLDEPVDELAHRSAVVAHRADARPVVVGRVEVVPRHLVHPHGHHRLEHGVDAAGDEAAGSELVDVEHGRMGEIKNQGVAERLVPLEVRCVVTDQIEQPLVERTGLMEIAADFGPLRRHRIGGRGIGGEQHRVGGRQRCLELGESAGRDTGWRRGDRGLHAAPQDSETLRT